MKPDMEVFIPVRLDRGDLVMEQFASDQGYAPGIWVQMNEDTELYSRAVFCVSKDARNTVTKLYINGFATKSSG